MGTEDSTLLPNSESKCDGCFGGHVEPDCPAHGIDSEQARINYMTPEERDAEYQRKFDSINATDSAPKHWVSKSCDGEKCRCGKSAAHKVGEEFLTGTHGITMEQILAHKDGEPLPELPSDPYENHYRHNLTAYLCCEHFSEVMGALAKEWCHV